MVLDAKGSPGARDNLTALLELARIAVIYKNYQDALTYAQNYLDQVERSKKAWVRSCASVAECPRLRTNA